MDIKEAEIKDLEKELDTKKQQLKTDIQKFKEKIENMKTSELMDLYPQVNDEMSVAFMDVFWERFPLDVLEDQKNDIDKRLDNLNERLRKIEQAVELESRILKRIDKLTQSIAKKRK